MAFSRWEIFKLFVALDDGGCRLTVVVLVAASAAFNVVMVVVVVVDYDDGDGGSGDTAIRFISKFSFYTFHSIDAITQLWYHYCCSFCCDMMVIEWAIVCVCCMCFSSSLCHSKLIVYIVMLNSVSLLTLVSLSLFASLSVCLSHIQDDLQSVSFSIYIYLLIVFSSSLCKFLFRLCFLNVFQLHVVPY